MAINIIDRKAMETIRAAVNAVLAGVAKDLGVGLTLGNGSFSSIDGHFKLNVTPVASNGVIESPERKAWPLYCESYGFEESDLGAEFYSNGHRYTIEGIRPSAHKMPMMVKRVDGKLFKMEAWSVLYALRPQAAMKNIPVYKDAHENAYERNDAAQD